MFLKSRISFVFDESGLSDVKIALTMEKFYAQSVDPDGRGRHGPGRRHQQAGNDDVRAGTLPGLVLAVAAGDPGALTLFGSASLTAGGKNASEHSLFGEHISGSETYVVTSGHGRQVHEWRWRPERADNHWFDCLVGCAAAASVMGVQVPGTQSQEQRRQRKRYTQADLVLKEWGAK